MIRASPCDFYLKYLCTHPDRSTDTAIRSLVKLQQLDFLGTDHLRRLRTTCQPPVPFYPEDLTHHESQRFLTKERIFYLHHPDEDTITAIKLLDNPRAKELTEAALASGSEPDWICMMLRRVSFQSTPRAIELYRHFYFNTSLVSHTEMRAILAMRIDSMVASSSSDGDALSYGHHYEKAFKTSLIASAAHAPISPFSHVLNMMRLGMMPTTVDLARVASVARMAAVVQSMESSLTGKAEQARDFALTGKIMTELIESVGDVSGDLQRSLMSLALDTDATEIPSIKQLTKGDDPIEIVPDLLKPDGPEVINVEAERT